MKTAAEYRTEITQRLKTIPSNLVKEILDHCKVSTIDEAIEKMVADWQHAMAVLKSTDDDVRATLDEMAATHPVILSDEQERKLTSICTILALQHDVTVPKDVWRCAMIKLRSLRAMSNIIPDNTWAVLGRSGISQNLREELYQALFQQGFHQLHQSDFQEDFH